VLRYSPAGVAILNCRLQHRSQQMEAGAGRNVELEIEAVALGTVALSLAKVAPQAELEIEGFLARKYRTGPALEMHITNFELKD
jgi:primosomal replication protein N